MKRRRTIKDRSRIPGISVGEEVDTSVGEKKKVCFNINGRWFFRMVDTGWRAPGRPLKGRGQRSEIRDQSQKKQPTRVETEGGQGKKGRKPKEGDGE